MMRRVSPRKIRAIPEKTFTGFMTKNKAKV